MRALIFSLIAGNISLLVAINANAQTQSWRIQPGESTLDWAERRRQEMVIQNAESQQLRDLIHRPSRWGNDQWQ